MKDLRFYDFEFNLLHIEHDFSSVYWNLKYNGIGTFEAEFAARSELNTICTKQKYLIVCQGEYQAIITNRQLKNNILRLNGRTVNFLLSKRTIPPFSTETLDIGKDSVSLAQYVINEACSDFITLGSSVTAEGFEELTINTRKPTDEVIVDCLNKDKLGHRLVFDVKNKKWVFDIYKGKERPLVLSDDNLNTFESEYSQSLLDYITSGYYYQKYDFKGDWDPFENSPPLYNNSPQNYAVAYKVTKDFTCFNIPFKTGDYIVCKSADGAFEKSEPCDGFWIYIDSKKQGPYRWDAFLNTDSEAQARKLVLENTIVEKASARLRNLQLGKDFDLGDIITFSQKTGNIITSLKRRITQVTIWFEKGNAMGIKPEFSEI